MNRASFGAAVLTCALAGPAAAAEPSEPSADDAIETPAADATAEPPPTATAERSLFTGACPKWDLDAPDEARRAAAQATMERAEALHQEGRWTEALATIDIAECHWPDRDYDYMRGVIFQTQGDCEAAIVSFTRFLASDPPEIDARAARSQIRACRPPPPADLPAPPPSAPPPHWSRDPAGASLLGVGIGTLVVGTALGIAARVEAHETAATFGEFQARRDRTRTLRAAAIGVLVTSAACLTGAVIRYAIVARRNRNATRTSEAARRHSVLGRMSGGRISLAK